MMTMLDSFAFRTSMHGVSRLSASRKSWTLIIWIAIFVSAWVLFSIQLYVLLKEYFQYPKKTTTKLAFAEAPFPDVTVCSHEALDFYAVHRVNNALLEDFIGSDASSTKSPSSPPRDKFVVAIRKYYDIINSTTIGENISDELEAKMFNRSKLPASIPFEMLSANSVQEEEFIVKCVFRGKPCKMKKIFDPYFFNCFTATTGATDESPATLLEGVENGISMTVFLGSQIFKDEKSPDPRGFPGIFDKNSPLSGSGGIRVVLHPPKTVPFPLTEGFDVPPSNLASIGVKSKVYRRIKEPHGRCAEKYPFLSREEQGEPYRNIGCVQVCVQKHIYEKCRCYESSLPSGKDFVRRQNNSTSKKSMKTCATDLKYQDMEKCFEGSAINKTTEEQCKKIEQCGGTMEYRKCFDVYSDKKPECSDKTLKDLYLKIQCADGTREKVMSNSSLLLECGCLPACSDVQYDVSYSLTRWPADGFQQSSAWFEVFSDLKFGERFACEKKTELFEKHVKDLGRNPERTMENFAKLNIYASDANAIVVAESPDQTVTTLLSNIGGLLGLWIGVSAITVAEVFELLVITITACWKKKHKKGDTEEEDEADTEGENSTIDDKNGKAC